VSFVALIVLGTVIAAVAIDAIRRRRDHHPPDPPDEPPKLTVDLTRR
jgi:hypothetical protein